MKILIIEDDPVVARWEREAVQSSPRLSADTFCVSSLSEARAFLQAIHVDCIILDPGLPDSSGADTVQAIAQECPDVPIVVVTGSLFHLAGTPVDAAVLKPVRASGLIESLLDAISSRVAKKEVAPLREGVEEAKAIVEQLAKGKEAT